MKDEQIIALFLLRDEAAIEQTDIKYGAHCFNISFGIVSSRETAEECVNDTYLSAWSSIPPQIPAKLPAYLYRIVRNISLERIRESYAKKRGGGEATLIYEELDECIASDISVEQQIKAAELAAHINLFLTELSRDDRIIFSFRYWLLLPISEIAQRLGCKESRVKTSLHRSRKKLRNYLIKEELI